MWRFLHETWWRLAQQSHPRSFPEAVGCALLAAGAVVYRLAAWSRSRLYAKGLIPSVRLPCAVISVGNLTVGGTGKTSCVELIARKLMAQGRRITVLSRGYGGRVPRPYWLRAEGDSLVMNGSAVNDRDGLADEPQVLARHLVGVPIVVGPRRAQTGQIACEQFGAEVAILDDGFQHRALRRDCDVVLVNARMPLGGWHLLPRGPMREPLSALSRADVIIVTKADQALSTVAALTERIRSLNPPAALLTAIHEPVALRDVASGRSMGLENARGRVVGASSIGDPEGFEETITRLGMSMAWHERFPDHYRYQPSDVDRLGAAAKRLGAEAIVTTEKDFVRLEPLLGPHGAIPVPVWVVEIRMRIVDGEDLFDDRLARLSPR